MWQHDGFSLGVWVRGTLRPPRTSKRTSESRDWRLLWSLKEFLKTGKGWAEAWSLIFVGRDCCAPGADTRACGHQPALCFRPVHLQPSR